MHICRSALADALLIGHYASVDADTLGLSLLTMK
jgi:hypothetical protein